MSLPGVGETHLVVYEKGARHHHQNEDREDPPPTDFTVMFFTTPESLGVRIKIKDEISRGSVIADVAVVYEWDRPATPDDDLDAFAKAVAIPQVLSCASATLCEAAAAVGSYAPFHGLQAVDKLITEFSERKRSLSEMLAQNTAEKKKAVNRKPAPKELKARPRKSK